MSTSSGAVWAARQLPDFLSRLTECTDEQAAVQLAAEAASGLPRVVAAAVVLGNMVVAQVGFPVGQAPGMALVRAARTAAASGPGAAVEVDGVGRCPVWAEPLGGTAAGHRPGPLSSGFLVVARQVPMRSAAERNLVSGMARALSLTLRQLTTLAVERELRAERERRIDDNGRLVKSLQQRQRLLEEFSRVQRAIATRAPLPEILNSITAGAAALFDRDTITLRLIDSDDPSYLVMVASHGLTPEQTAARWRLSFEQAGLAPVIDDGILLRAEITEVNFLEPVTAEGCVAEDCPTPRCSTGDPAATDGTAADCSAVERRAATGPAADGDQGIGGPVPDADGLELSRIMAAPVRENGEIIGCLIVGAKEPGRRYSATDETMLTGFADHVSLALTDARGMQAVHHAFHDALTGLPNRSLLMERLGQALVRAQRGRSTVALFFVDLDRFKIVNDTLGHQAGDALLIEVANRLKVAVRPDDTVARFGGDEFVVLVEHGPEVTFDPVRVARRLLDAVTPAFAVAGRQVSVNASVGIATSINGEEEPDDLIRDADVAMYRAKKLGPGRYEFFEPTMYHQLVERLELEADLQRAVGNDELVLAYQPVINLETGVIAGVEALVRWQHPVRGLIGPPQFIPLAEETRVIEQLTPWVLREACQTLSGWLEELGELAPPMVAVNLAVRNLQQPDLLEVVRDTLNDARLASHRLVLEITESGLITDTERTVVLLRGLKALGIRIALDDFGTGFSALSLLRELPLDILKIDKAFLADIDRSTRAADFVRSVISLGTTLGLETVAEGIERPGQLDELHGSDCRLGQGFLLGRPVFADEMRRRLTAAQPQIRRAV
jgi:diguanylate cyclase (GGDEF)-like protein